MAKDNFSGHADQYARYRPTYPAELFEYLNSLVTHRGQAWDCGTGNGQVAIQLANTFTHVHATDISQQQLDQAPSASNITYSCQPAESTDFPSQLFDLIVVAQAIHWFDFDQFYAEVRRTAKPQALLCVVGYGKLEISPAIDQCIGAFYEDVIGPYWDPERKYIDEHYQTIPFPFHEITTPAFVSTHQWTLDQLIGYLNTWSAVKHFIKQRGFNPVDELHAELARLWTRDEVRFPLLLRLGSVGRAV